MTEASAAPVRAARVEGALAEGALAELVQAALVVEGSGASVWVASAQAPEATLAVVVKE